MNNSILYNGVALVVGAAFFVLAVFSTFTGAEPTYVRLDPILLTVVSFVAGAIAVLAGYTSIVTFGGRFSVGAARFISRVTGSRQVLEVVEDLPSGLSGKLVSQAHLAYLPVLLLLISLALSWDIFTLDTARSGVVRPFFHLLDIFTRNLRVDPVRFSLELVPIILMLTFVAGIVPSMVLPYFGRFRVTGVNDSPFHKGFLITTLAAVAGISAIFALSALFYETLFTSQEPLYYHYALLQMVGICLYFAVGSSLGLEKAGIGIMKDLEASKAEDLVFLGTVSVG
jgi:hypothetical protein